MSFLNDVAGAKALLAESGRVSLRGLRRQFALDDETLEELVEELVDVQRVARREGNVLVFAGAAATLDSAGVSPPTPARASPGVRPTADVAPPTTSAEAGERRQLTVMFCDLVGSTTLAEQLDPEELRGLVRRYRAVCEEATTRFGGHIAQYLGDGVMVFFGYPDAREDAADSSIRAGLEIQRLIAARVADERIQARIGIHTGLVIIEESGSEDTGVLGSTTNVAARIEGVATPGSVVVSDATLALCRGVLVSKSLGQTKLKGLDERVLLHEIERSAGVRSAIATDALKPMVGRDREIGLLLDRWEEVQDGRGQVVLVSSEAGMGKSRLLQALRDEVAETPHLWLDMQCSPFASGSAFQPIVDLFHTGLSEGVEESPERVSELLVAGLESLPGLPGEKVVPYLLPLLGLPASERYPLPQTSADEQRERMLAALVQLTLALSEPQPLVLVTEDLHWADPSTLEYLSRIVGQAPTARVLLVLTFRPEFRAPWQQSHVSELKLARLSRRMTRELIANAVGGKLPEPVLAELETRSDGVPLFVEELTSSVVGSGVMVEKAGRYELSGSLKDLAIPATLQDSLMARLDRLSRSKHLAQEGATLGREFSYELIEAVSKLDTPSLRNALEQLAMAEILHQRGTPPDASYTFKHALLQDAAYESQLLSTRRVLHGKIAAVLEERFPQRVAAEPESIARHWAAAGESTMAVDYYERAAELAVSRHSNQEASDHYTRALDSLMRLPDGEERKQREIAVRLAHGQSLMILHGYRAPEVLAAFERVRELCDAIEEGPQQLPALIGLAQFDMARGAALEAGVRAEALLRIAEPLGVRELLVLGHYLAGVAALLTASLGDVAERLSRALEILPTVDFPPPATPYTLDLVSSLYAVNSIALMNGVKFEQARDAMRACRERLSEIDHDYSKASSLSTFAIAWMNAGDPEAARATAEEALAVAEGRGFHTEEAISLIVGGWARACQGGADEGARNVEGGIALAETSGSAVLSATLCVFAAETYRMAQNRERARELLDQATEVCERDGLLLQAPFIPFAKARIHLQFGDGLVAAESLFLQAVREGDAVGLHGLTLIAGTHLARLAPHTGKIREAHDRLAASYARLTEGFDRPPAREAKAALDELAAQIHAEPRAS